MTKQIRAPKPTHIPLERTDLYGPMRLMAIADDYVMARRKGRPPFVVSTQEWCGIGETDGKVVAIKVVPSMPVL